MGCDLVAALMGVPRLVEQNIFYKVGLSKVLTSRVNASYWGGLIEVMVLLSQPVFTVVGFSWAVLLFKTLRIVLLCVATWRLGRARSTTVGLVVSGMSNIPVCRRVGRRVGTTVLSNRLRTRRALPSLEALTGSLGVDILAIAGTCARLRRRNFIGGIRKHKYFMVKSNSRLVGRRLVYGMRGGLARTVGTTEVTGLSARRLRHLLSVLARMGASSWLFENGRSFGVF